MDEKLCPIASPVKDSYKRTVMTFCVRERCMWWCGSNTPDQNIGICAIAAIPMYLNEIYQDH